MISFVSPQKLLLVLVVLIAVLFRSYNITNLHPFNHDADLYSYIVKDIVVDKHLRLIGQLTSTEGVFIGPFFYYVLSPFFLITNMDPIGVVFFIALIAAFGVWSIYFIFKNLIGFRIGIIAAFLLAVLPIWVGLDRWIVPTVTVNIWCLWYFYSLANILAGRSKYLILSLFLLGLIWHVHLALAPLALLVFLALFLSRKNPNLKIWSLGIIAFLIPMIPFIIFELRHSFIQTQSIVNSFGEHSSLGLLKRIRKVLNTSLSQSDLVKLIMLVLPVFLYKIKAFNLKLLIIFYAWIITVLSFFILSSKDVSEYYFTNIQSVYLILEVYLLNRIIKNKRYGILLIWVILTIVFAYSLLDLLSIKSHKSGYIEKREVSQFIKDNAVLQGLPCYSVTYIIGSGDSTGFRYLFWLYGIKLQRPREGIPNYTIVIPYKLSADSVNKTFGEIGVIVSPNKYNLDEVKLKCSDEDYNLTNSILGFTN